VQQYTRLFDQRKRNSGEKTVGEEGCWKTLKESKGERIQGIGSFIWRMRRNVHNLRVLREGRMMWKTH